MSLSEWSDLIRTDDRYGWRYTKQANEEVSSLALALGEMFGKAAA